MELEEQKNKISNDDATKNENAFHKNKKKLEESEKRNEKAINIDSDSAHQLATKNKCVSFHFERKSNDSKTVSLNTTQICSNNLDGENCLVHGVPKGRCNKSAYLNLHRYNVSSGSNVEKLKGKYENLTEQTDNGFTPNISTKSNTDNTSDNNLKTHIKCTEPGNGNISEITNANSKPFQSKRVNAESKSLIRSNNPQISISKTTSNIEKLQRNLTTKLTEDTIQKLRSKYSPASFGFPKPVKETKPVQETSTNYNAPTKIPVPTPRVFLKYSNKDSIADKKGSTLKNNYNSKIKDQVKILAIQPTSVSNNTEKVPLQKNRREDIHILEIKDFKRKFRVPLSTEPTVKLDNSLFKNQNANVPTKISQTVNRNVEEEKNCKEVLVTYDTIEFAEPEAKHFIVRGSSSEDSVDKVEHFFSEIIMDKKLKEKKRSNSFRKLLTGSFFNRDKKKQEETKQKERKRDNAVFSDNAQNEFQAIDRHAPYRHTIDNTYPRRDIQKRTVYLQKSLEADPVYYCSSKPKSKENAEGRIASCYTEMKGISLQSNKKVNPGPEDYVPMDNRNFDRFNSKPGTYRNLTQQIDSSSSSCNTLESENRNCTYENALIAQAEMRLLNEKQNIPRATHKNSMPFIVNKKNSFTRSNSVSEGCDKFRNSGEVLQRYHNVQLVKPKAHIPINSERPLPNPYQNKITKNEMYENMERSETLDRNLNSESKKIYSGKKNAYEGHQMQDTVGNNNAVMVEDIYGTVFDCITSSKSNHTPSLLNESYDKDVRSFQDSKVTRCSNKIDCKNASEEIKKTQANENVFHNQCCDQELLRNPSPAFRVSQTETPELLQYNSLSPKSSRAGSSCNSPISRISGSPKSFESTKLKLPTNREKIELRPRIRSPIPQTAVSTDKIIATELLRNTKSPTGTSILPNTEGDPDSLNVTISKNDLLVDTLNVSPNLHSNLYNFESNSRSDYFKLNSLGNAKPPPSPRDISRCLEAAEWQRRQRELDKSPALEAPLQITTNVVVHATSDQETTDKMSPLSRHCQFGVPYNQRPSSSPKSINSSLTNIRSCTPVNQIHSSPNNKSPEKQQILQNIEAFYWRELKKLKEREEQELIKYRQQQMYVYGYVEDPVLTRRSRSVSPSIQRGRRSLSLPRDIKSPGRSIPTITQPLPEGRSAIVKQIVFPNNSVYGHVQQPFQRNPNFVRNSFERSSIGLRQNPHDLYRDSSPLERKSKDCIPIFKRGSLTGDVSIPEDQLQNPKKVSFLGNRNVEEYSNWPTKNGFITSPPTRRVDRNISLDDDVFFPASPNNSRHFTLSDCNLIQQPIYQNYVGHRTPKNSGIKSKFPADYSQRNYYSNTEPVYEPQTNKHITVKNKVCDIYGQIYDPSELRYPVPQNYRQIKQSGILYGQIQPNTNKVVMPSFSNVKTAPTSNFVRGTRLTASVNDMYKRYPTTSQSDHTLRLQNYSWEAPQGPLPPVPERVDSRIPLRKQGRMYLPTSDTEIGAEVGEVQRIMQTKKRQGHFGRIGK